MTRDFVSTPADDDPDAARLSVDRFRAATYALQVLLTYDRAADADEIKARLEALEARAGASR